jgi:flagellar assembly protein FliH
VDLAALERIGAAEHLPVGVALVADPTLAPGDAVSEFPGGYLDARIESAVERARCALADS